MSGLFPGSSLDVVALEKDGQPNGCIQRCYGAASMDILHADVNRWSTPDLSFWLASGSTIGIMPPSV
jgi:hypothetical protein